MVETRQPLQQTTRKKRDPCLRMQTIGKSEKEEKERGITLLQVPLDVLWLKCVSLSPLYVHGQGEMKICPNVATSLSNQIPLSRKQSSSLSLFPNKKAHTGV